VLDSAIQIRSKDGFVYAYVPKEACWYKFCPVDALPLDVLKTVTELKNKADLLKEAV